MTEVTLCERCKGRKKISPKCAETGANTGDKRIIKCPDCKGTGRSMKKKEEENK